MNIAIILAGGTGTRLGSDIPKQYIEVNDKPIISYCIDKFEKNDKIDGIIIVAADMWQDYIKEHITGISKFLCFAPAGSSRQHSILNGMKACPSDTDSVIIHDAARPNVSDKTIFECMEGLKEYDGVMPVLPVKDTIYFSETGAEINSLLNRDQLFAGQAPESFNYKKYMQIHDGMREADLEAVRGSSEIAFKNSMRVKLIEGDEHNYKITTMFDLDKFKAEVE